MKLKIVGSGGCVSTPKPCCTCRVCKEAREKGFPYARSGCSLFIEDEKILFDTPEDICYGLNNAEVDDVQMVLYSHSDPDHTMGMRVFEQLRLNWMEVSVGNTCENPIDLISLPAIIDELKQQSTCKGPVLDYYEWRNLVSCKKQYSVEKGDITIQSIPVDETERIAIFVIMQGDKKVIYAPCDVKPFPEHEIFQGADLLIIGNTIIGEVLKGGWILGPNNPFRESLFAMEEIIALKEKYSIPQVIMTHIEEDWGKSYDDYLELEKEYDGIRFAYDGMEIIM